MFASPIESNNKNMKNTDKKFIVLRQYFWGSCSLSSRARCRLPLTVCMYCDWNFLQPFRVLFPHWKEGDLCRCSTKTQVTQSKIPVLTTLKYWILQTLLSSLDKSCSTQKHIQWDIFKRVSGHGSSFPIENFCKYDLWSPRWKWRVKGQTVTNTKRFLSFPSCLLSTPEICRRKPRWCDLTRAENHSFQCTSG